MAISAPQNRGNLHRRNCFSILSYIVFSFSEETAFMDTKDIAIGIVGVGMVGSAVSDYYKKKGGFLVIEYDKYKNIGVLGDAVKADYVFICLPSLTREDGTQDLDSFEEVLPRVPDGVKVIIKSTVLPGTTEKFAKRFPGPLFFHNPEFLDARTAIYDFAHPDLQVVGSAGSSRHHADEIMKILPPAPHSFVCESSESEMVKYFMNTFMATKNTFANQVYDYCAAKHIEYEKVKDIVQNAPRVGGEVHLKIFADGYRGFSGACLPKDIYALIRDARDEGAQLKLLEEVKMLNDQYLEDSQGKNFSQNMPH